MTNQAELSEEEMEQASCAIWSRSSTPWVTRADPSSRRQRMAFDMIMAFPEELGISDAQLRMAMARRTCKL